MSLEGNAPLEDEMEVDNANKAGPLIFEGFRSKWEIVTITGEYRDDKSEGWEYLLPSRGELCMTFLCLRNMICKS
jgi:hypothetical protein